jgi:hypothetical protein
VFDFNQQYVRPAEAAREQAVALLGDESLRETLMTEISDAVSSFPLELGADWELAVEIDDSTLAAFEPNELDLVRANPAPNGYFMTLWTTGDARFDLGSERRTPTPCRMTVRSACGIGIGTSRWLRPKPRTLPDSWWRYEWRMPSSRSLSRT